MFQKYESVSDFICHHSLLSLLFPFSPPLTWPITQKHAGAQTCYAPYLSSSQLGSAHYLLGHFSLNATIPHLLLLLAFPRGGPCTFPDTIRSHLAQKIVSAASLYPAHLSISTWLGALQPSIVFLKTIPKKIKIKIKTIPVSSFYTLEMPYLSFLPFT